MSRRLRDLLGVGPGPELQRLYSELLTATDADSMVIPRQLPSAVPGFAGRTDQLHALDNLVAANRLGVVIGPPGVGKTALAIHWARRVEDRFPDGTLYADLRGYAPDADPADPRAILPRFLATLGIPSDRLPTTTDDQIALYRSLLAGRSVLVVLDNARSAEQVRPLTGARSCTVVTSRNELGDLVATEQAVPIRLEALDPAESRKLLAARVGDERLQADAESTEMLLAACAGLPLALSLLAAQIALRPRWTLSMFATRVNEALLDALAVADGIDVRTIFSWTYRQLRPEEARLFRLLGQHPGAEITLRAAAALAGTSIRSARQLLDVLVGQHQLVEIAPDRYAMHDLLREYARELADPEEAEAAFIRLLGYLVHTGVAAALQIARGRLPVDVPDPDPSLELELPTTREEAYAWFDSEQTNSLAVLRAAAGRADDLLWVYVWAIADYLDFAGRAEYLEAEHLGFAAAVRLGDLRKQAKTRRDLARGHMSLRQWDEAIRHHELALDIAEELADEEAIAHSSLSIGRVLTRMGRQREAIATTTRALRLYERLELHDSQANALNNLGWYHALLGENELAVRYAEDALKLYEQVESEYGRAVVSDTLVYALAADGRLDEAIASYTTAIEIHHRLGRRLDSVECLTSRAGVQERVGDRDGAIASWSAALEILEAADHPDAEPVRRSLEAAQQR
ncbi:hypothetical protein GCM10009745_41720 [Kribbella yunnanensis]|uniref:Tetratricopeptide repeat protein n=1 Tax=Kribbella yunnanensis TaxID=190194 RepID=A0ABP4TQG5_9ACTN